MYANIVHKMYDYSFKCDFYNGVHVEKMIKIFQPTDKEFCDFMQMISDYFYFKLFKVHQPIFAVPKNYDEPISFNDYDNDGLNYSLESTNTFSVADIKLKDFFKSIKNNDYRVIYFYKFSEELYNMLNLDLDIHIRIDVINY